MMLPLLGLRDYLIIPSLITAKDASPLAMPKNLKCIEIATTYGGASTQQLYAKERLLQRSFVYQFEKDLLHFNRRSTAVSNP